MKKDMLLPYGFKKVGWAILIPVVVYHLIVIIIGSDNDVVGKALFSALGLTVKSAGAWSFMYNAEQWLNNICICGAILGGLFIGCSREKIEDELIGHIRHDSLLIALWVNYITLLVLSLSVYSSDFFTVLVYNMFTMLFIFIIIFRIKLWRLRKEASNEK